MHRFLFLLCTICCSGALFAQDTTDIAYYFDDGGLSTKRHVIKMNLAPLVIGDAGINYEFRATDRIALEVGVGVLLPNYRPSRVALGARKYENVDGMGLSWNVAYRSYFGSTAPFGFVGGLNWRQRRSPMPDGSKIIENDFTASFGYQWSPNDKMVMEVGAGLGANNTTLHPADPTERRGPMEPEGLLWPLMIKIGF